MKTNKTMQVIMLPTEQATRLYKARTGGLGYYNEPKTYTVAGQGQHLYLISDAEIKEGDWCYIDDVSYDGIAQVTKVGGLGIVYFDKQSVCYGSNELKGKVWKIEATTDSSLGINICERHKSLLTNVDARCTCGGVRLPQIPQSFVEAYAKSNGTIKEVQVEMIEKSVHEVQSFTKHEYRIKTRDDNTVIIHPSKTYTREEVKRLCFQAFIDHKCVDGKIKPSEAENLIEPFEKWTKDNLK